MRKICVEFINVWFLLSQCNVDDNMNSQFCVQYLMHLTVFNMILIKLFFHVVSDKKKKQNE